MTAPIDLDVIEALAAAASEAPWRVVENGGDLFIKSAAMRPKSPAAPGGYSCGPSPIYMLTRVTVTLADAEFIAAARTNVPASVAEIRCLRLQLDTARETIEHLVTRQPTGEEAGSSAAPPTP
jgi:hypothetical protein